MLSAVWSCFILHLNRKLYGCEQCQQVNLLKMCFENLTNWRDDHQGYVYCQPLTKEKKITLLKDLVNVKEQKYARVFLEVDLLPCDTIGLKSGGYILNLRDIWMTMVGVPGKFNLLKNNKVHLLGKCIYSLLLPDAFILFCFVHL